MDKMTVLKMIQEAGNKVAEAMGIVEQLGAENGITVRFEKVPREVTVSELAEMAGVDYAMLADVFDLIWDYELTVVEDDEDEFPDD